MNMSDQVRLDMIQSLADLRTRQVGEARQLLATLIEAIDAEIPAMSEEFIQALEAARSWLKEE